MMTSSCSFHIICYLIRLVSTKINVATTVLIKQVKSETNPFLLVKKFKQIEQLILKWEKSIQIKKEKEQMNKIRTNADVGK